MYIQAYEQTATNTTLHPEFIGDFYSILKRMQLWSFFHSINNVHQNVKFALEEESNGDLVFFWHFIQWK